MTNKFIITTFVLFCCFRGYSQQYRTAVGVRFAAEKGISIQQSIGNKITLEGIFTVPDKKEVYNISLLLEKHINLISRRWNIYFGLGPQTGFLNGEKLFRNNTYGVNTIAGMELSFGRLNCSVDLKPLIQIDSKTSSDLINYQYGVSVRYILVKRDSFWKKAKKKLSRNI
ncbi:MAG: hypothetical protein ACOYOA_12880 [Saprospiraceae bacterium]